jgi:N-ethylmaleimide reductase
VAAFDDSPVASTFLIYFQDAIIDQDQGRSAIIVYSTIVSVDERCLPSSRCPLGTTRKRDVMESATDNTRTRSDLFGPLRLGPYLLANRIVMAPLTRSRAGEDGVPRPLMAEYYAQRASAGLIIAEGTNISPEGRGYALTPGIYDDAQVEGWRQVTEAVHARGGRIFPQLWHVGRVSHPSLQPGGVLPVAPSAVRPQATSYTEGGFQACVTPRALATAEIPDIVEQYRHAARNALAAGFDGVEIHAANGYLIEQFLRDSTNKRTDAYGGSQENRARLLLEVTKAVVGVCGGERVGIRLSPVSPVNGSDLDSDPAATYTYTVERLNAFALAYIHIIEGATQGSRDVPGGFDLQILRHAFKGLYIANNGYDLKLALEARRYNLADLVSFGRLYIANPDLVERLRIGTRLNAPDRATFFGGGAAGYNDYPILTPADRDAA